MGKQKKTKNIKLSIEISEDQISAIEESANEAGYKIKDMKEFLKILLVDIGVTETIEDLTDVEEITDVIEDLKIELIKNEIIESSEEGEEDDEDVDMLTENYN